MSKDDNRKIRADFRKNRLPRTRERDLTRRFEQDGLDEDSMSRGERVSGKGDLTRKRTVIGTEVGNSETGFGVRLEIDSAECLKGRVLSVHGLSSTVQAEDGKLYKCATRRLLKTLSTDLRHVVIAGDRVLFRLASGDGIIERVEPRRGVLSRTSKGRQHAIVVNVDQILIIASAAQPDLKPNLIDRFLITAEQNRIRPILCINKIDLVDPADLQPLVGVYGQMGYQVFFISATSGFGVDRLRNHLKGKETAVVGQSGVGKSSLLNCLDPGMNLRVREVSEENEKGKHTTTTAVLLPLSFGGFVVDTPGIRQFELWDVIPEEVAGFFRDIRPFINGCRFPNCTHTHESPCAVKDAVADGKLDARRYESYCHLHSGK